MDWPGSATSNVASPNLIRNSSDLSFIETDHSYKSNPAMQVQLDRNIFFQSIIEICTLVFEFCIDPKRSIIFFIIGVLFFRITILFF